MKKLFTLTLFVVLFTSCSIHVMNNINATVPITFEILKQESYGGKEKEGDIVITSQQQLKSLYSELGWDNIPEVDFSTNNVVALFMGQKNNGGYSIGIKKISIDGDTATVTVYETTPEGMATMAITTPYCIAVIPKTETVIIKR